MNYRKGDIVHVRAKIVGKNIGDNYVVNFEGLDTTVVILPSDIVTVESCPFKVGDRVKWNVHSFYYYFGVVLAITKTCAWVDATENGITDPLTFLLSELQHADQE